MEGRITISMHLQPVTFAVSSVRLLDTANRFDLHLTSSPYPLGLWPWAQSLVCGHPNCTMSPRETFHANVLNSSKSKYCRKRPTNDDDIIANNHKKRIHPPASLTRKVGTRAMRYRRTKQLAKPDIDQFNRTSIDEVLCCSSVRAREHEQ